MHIDYRVFLSRPQDLPAEELEGADLAESLKQAAQGADKIVILTGYYGTDYLKTAFAGMNKGQRRSCSLTLVFGFESRARLPHVVSELRDLRAELTAIGFRSPS